MTIECPVPPELKPWYDAFYDALEEVARERGDDACDATLAELRIQRRRGVSLNLQTLADVLGRLEVELGDFARRVDRRGAAARAGAVEGYGWCLSLSF